MNDLTKSTLISKRDFTSEKRKNYSFREEFRISELVRIDSEYKYVLIVPLLKNRDNSDDEVELLYNLNSLSSHFYFKTK